MQITDTNPSDFIKSLPKETSEQISQLDKLIRKAAPKAKRVMWEGKFWGGSEQKIIGYGEYTYTNASKQQVNWFVVGLANQKNYITVFVNAADGKQYLTEKYKGKLGKVKLGKSAINIKSIEDVELETLKSLIIEAFEVIQGE